MVVFFTCCHFQGLSRHLGHFGFCPDGDQLKGMSVTFQAVSVYLNAPLLHHAEVDGDSSKPDVSIYLKWAELSSFWFQSSSPCSLGHEYMNDTCCNLGVLRAHKLLEKHWKIWAIAAGKFTRKSKQSIKALKIVYWLAEFNCKINHVCSCSTSLNNWNWSLCVKDSDSLHKPE